MARRYISYSEKIAKAKTDEQRKKLLAEAKALYGKSYVTEYLALLAKQMQRRFLFPAPEPIRGSIKGTGRPLQQIQNLKARKETKK